jgi:hypothetical protein
VKTVLPGLDVSATVMGWNLWEGRVTCAAFIAALVVLVVGRRPSSVRLRGWALVAAGIVALAVASSFVSKPRSHAGVEVSFPQDVFAFIPESERPKSIPNMVLRSGPMFGPYVALVLGIIVLVRGVRVLKGQVPD